MCLPSSSQCREGVVVRPVSGRVGWRQPAVFSELRLELKCVTFQLSELLCPEYGLVCNRHTALYSKMKFLRS